MDNPVLDCIHTRRSVRDFLDKPIEKEMIDKILEAGVMAPSAMNSQPWNFTIVEGKEKIRYFGEKSLKQWNVLGLGVKLGLKLTKAESIFYNAPLLIIVSGKKSYDFLKDDINLCVQNMFLAAHSLGLGSCWIGFALPLAKDKEAMSELGIPGDFDIVAPLIFGYPKKQVASVPKRKIKVLRWIK